jgi:hypothetical protein
MPDNSVPLLTPQTLLNIAVLVAQHEASLWHDRTPSHISVLTGSQYVEELLDCGYSSCPLVGGYVDRETTRSMMGRSSCQ